MVNRATTANRFGNAIGIEAVSFIPTSASRKYGEVDLKFTNKASVGHGDAPLGTGEINASGVDNTWRISSGDELDVLFPVPGDFDATATSFVTCYYTIASSTIATNDTITPVFTYNIPALNTPTGTKIANAATTTGLTNPTAITLGTGVGVGSMYSVQATLSSASTLAADGVCQIRVDNRLSGTDDLEVRMFTKAVFKYARTYI